MSDTPDFDSMSPEEMMEWMESLAKRQGAAEGFTTNASMEVEEVDESDERLAGQGEYKPYGMSDEQWAEIQAREESEKAARMAALQQQEQQAAPTPPPAPEPEPEPEPAATEPAAAGGQPDFDSMSPEEMMEWMESLAKRQGAAEGFTTNASMEVEEVDESDERLAGQGEYKPYGMSDEQWAEIKAREESEKAARLAAMQEQDAVASDAVDDDVEYAYDDDEDYIEYDDEDYIEYDDEDYYEDDEESELVQADLSMLGFDAPPEPDAQDEPATQDPAAWLAGLAGSDDDSGDTQPDIPAQAQPAAQDPTDWLAGLSQEDEQPNLELDMDALASLENLGTESSGDDPMSWLSSLSGETDDDNDLSSLGDIVAADTDLEGGMEGSMEWMESLARRQGANTEELVTDGDLDVPTPASVDDNGPGYEDFSFEEATGMMQDISSTDSMQVTGDPNPDMELEDPAGWLDQLASGVNDSTELPDDLFSSDNNIIGMDDDDFDSAAVLDDADGDDDFDSMAENVKSQIDSGRLGDSPEDVDKFFQSAFARASTRDVPDYLDPDEDSYDDADDDELPVQAEIPDWLEESMATAQPTMDAQATSDAGADIPAKKDTAEMMIADLGLEDALEEADIPDWLQGGMEDDSGDIGDDIFDEMIEDEVEATSQLTPLDLTDTQDTWVEAFNLEESQDLASWYEDARAQAAGDEVDTPIEAASEPAGAAITLQAADLPIETELVEGSPQTVPDWLTGDAEPIRETHQSVEMEAAPVDAGDMDMDWLSEGEEGAIEADMPDWLRENVDDSVADSDDLPDWLAGETDISPDEIPDWLRETMDEDEELATIEAFEPDPEPAIVAAPAQTTLPATTQQSPAPVPVEAENVDAVAYLRAAKEKLAGDDLAGALRDYELVIRANKALPQVEKELQRLTDDDAYKKNPAVNRVLGDVLMRQGKLQDALDIYRRALNML